MFFFANLHSKHNTFTTSYRTCSIYTHHNQIFRNLYTYIWNNIQSKYILLFTKKQLQCEDLGTSPLGLTKTGQCLFLLKHV